MKCVAQLLLPSTFASIVRTARPWGGTSKLLTACQSSAEEASYEARNPSQVLVSQPSLPSLFYDTNAKFVGAVLLEDSKGSEQRA